MVNKEIDIIDLFVLIYKFYKRRKLILFLSIIIGIVFGTASYFLTKNTYVTNLFVNSSIINKGLLNQSFSPLKVNLKTANYDFLVKKMNLDINVIKQLKNFVVDTSVENSIKLEIELYDKKALTKISNGLVYYINNLNFVKGKISVERENIKKYITEIDSQLIYLKKTQNMLMYKLTNSNNFQVENIGNINKAYVDIYQKRIDMQKMYNSANQVFLYNDISQNFEPQNSLLKKIIMDVAIFFLIGFFISLYLEIKMLVKSRLE